MKAILYVSRTAIRPMLRQQLKQAGVPDVATAETIDACLDLLHQEPGALLVLDWENGTADVNAALRVARGSRSIFLIASEVSLDVVAVGAEYHVSRIHTGEFTNKALDEHLRALMAEEQVTRGYRAALVRVAETRASGDLAGASRELMDLHRQYPDDRRLTCELADSMIHEDRWDEALAVLEELSIAERHNLRVQHLMARCLMKKGRFDEAAERLAQCKLINPHNPERLVDLGNALLQTGRVREALTNFEEALAIDPQLLDASLGMAQCQLVEGDVNEALALVRQVSGPRELAAVFNNAAILCVRQQKMAQGLSLYKTAIAALGPQEGGLCARLFLNLGLAYHRQQRDGDALACFEQATKLDRSYDKPRKNAKILAARLGRLKPEGDDRYTEVEEFSDEVLQATRGAA